MNYLKKSMKAIRLKENMTQKELANALNVSESRIKSLETGRVKELNVHEANKMVNKFNLNLDWLVTGEGSMYKSDAQAAPVPQDDLVQIPEYDVELSAGYGAYPADHALAVGNRPFSMSWLKKKGLNAKILSLVRVAGDSMEPLLKDKDMVMIDSSRTKPTEAMPFAVRLNDELLVKTIQNQGSGNIALVSRNKAYNDITINQQNPPHDFQIIGAVVWHAHSWI